MRKPLIVGSIVVHACAVAALSIAAMWRIEKLPVQDRGGVVASFALPHDSGGGAAPPKQALVAKVDKPKVKVKDNVQPVKVTQETKAVTDAPTTDVVGDSLDGKLGNGTGGTGDGLKVPTGGGCVVEPCPKDETKPDTKKEETKKEVVKKKERIIIPETDASRISGNSRIEAPDNVKVQMQRADEHKVIGTIKLCVSERGDVTSASVAKSTGYDAYDDKLVSQMSQWRYESLVRGGEKIPFCTYVTLVYKMN